MSTERTVGGITGNANATANNVRTVLDLERRARERATIGARISRRVTRITGTIGFAFVNCFAFSAWVAINSGWVRTARPFDPYPYSFLTLALSVEAILLSVFVLMSENQESRHAESRAQLDLQINVLAEQELTAALAMLSALCQHLKVSVDVPDEQLRQWLRSTSVDRLAEEIESEQQADADAKT
jgi:uncharacterized membrane protein